MNEPILVTANSYSEAWAEAIFQLKEHSWNIWNLVVTIKSPAVRDASAFSLMTDFSRDNNLLTPKQVQHTIFPQQFYESLRVHSRDDLYNYYNRFYRRTRKQPHSGWGTYFKRMIDYETADGHVDQLGRIIDHINTWPRNHQAAHFMLIPQPYKEGNRHTGTPCLNYIAIQVEKGINDQRIISLLGVYRNHDFLHRAFGNYLGLCDLLSYICCETNSSVGYLTCVSSHAYVDNNHTSLVNMAEQMLGRQDE